MCSGGGSQTGGGAGDRPADLGPADRAAAPARRSTMKFETPALIAAAMPSSNAATAPTAQPDGPTTASLPSPSGPPANAARIPVSTPVIAPQAMPHSGAASRLSVGAILISSHPPVPPAR